MTMTVAIIGIGSIGGSMAQGLRAARIGVIRGFDTDPATRTWAREHDLVDTVHETLLDTTEGSDLIVLAIPPSAIAEVCHELLPHRTAEQTVTDVGSTKMPILQAIEERCGCVPPWFVPGHPIAGTEKIGVQHADGNLFQDRCAVLTPLDDTDPERVDKVRWMWEQLGARTQQMEAVEHDTLFAGISHLPHVLAFALMDLLAQEFSPEDLKRYAAGGLLDFTRIASSNPQLWADICHGNQAQLIPILQRYQAHIGTLLEALHEDRVDILEQSFSTAQRIREHLRQGE